jgi:DMSO/TMAO reductase YedYZ heme-binding membrane subunit
VVQPRSQRTGCCLEQRGRDDDRPDGDRRCVDHTVDGHDLSGTLERLAVDHTDDHPLGGIVVAVAGPAHLEPRELTMNLAWYVSRGAGLVSWGILALSIVWGLVLSSSILGRHPGPKWLLDVHRFLGGLSIVFVGVHLVALLADQYVSFTPTQLLVPFTSSYRPAAVAAGVVALYLLVAVEVTSLVRRWIPRRVWRGVHLASYGLFVLGTVHLITAGTDGTSPPVLATVVVTSTIIAIGTVAHVLRRQAEAARRAAQPARSRAPRAPALAPLDFSTSSRFIPSQPSSVPVPPVPAVPNLWTMPDRPPVREPSAP